MQRSAGLHKRMIITKLSTEVDSFFQIRFAGRQFAADREVSSPGSTTTRHSDLEFCLEILSEELSADFLEPLLEVFIDPMIDDVKETAVAAGLSDSGCDFAMIFGVGQECTDINEGDNH